MADKKEEKPQQKEKKQQEKKPEVKEKPKKEEIAYESLVRIFGYDIPGSKNIYTGLTRIKGISWTLSRAICVGLAIPISKKISELTKPEIAQIESFLEKLPVPDYLKNRRNDLETGETKHLLGTDLEITKDFDIKRLRKMKSYRGLRHGLGQPVRGQRTRSHFRKKKTATVGKKKPAPEKKGGAK